MAPTTHHFMDDCCKTKEGSGKIGDCCIDIHDELEAAKTETGKLMKYLQIQLLSAPQKDAPKNEVEVVPQMSGLSAPTDGPLGLSSKDVRPIKLLFMP